MNDNEGNDTFDGFDEAAADDALEDALRQAAAILDPVPAELRHIAVEAYALHALRDMDAELAELTFDSVVDAAPVRGADVPRMLTFSTSALTVDVEVTVEGMTGQLLPPQPARIEILGTAQPAAATTVTADEMGRFLCEGVLTGPFALRLRTDEEVVVTEWLRV
ncbi:hypothetical protein [Streptomyces ureilyticus]|uniref:Carboxypeptidase regulatory-like domain-containing protein n=1 Tax=Streptomyces ureilyticus TaxID=1775131 RepID=A0ABX0DYK2_9ACTN|nr:hypothetical protein [Streptomyces ureilyticus]NGO44102.1 hypothetical protein [Streptomyces ureilyticus]